MASSHELADKLNKLPDFQLEFVFLEMRKDTELTGEVVVNLRRFTNIDISDVGYSDKVVVLCGDEEYL